MGPGQQGIHVEKTMEIDAPAEKVFDFFAHPENYLRISDVVTNVEVFGDGRFAKEMAIAGVPVRFEERFVRCEENELIETHSEPRSALQYCKQLKFEPAGDHHTRLHLHFWYHPPGGVIGHAAATLFGFDPKSVLTELLMRAKFFLETGREPHDAVARRTTKAKRPAAMASAAHRAEHDEAIPRGPGAPMEDVRRPGMNDFETQSPWPPSTDVEPRPAEPSGHFPTAID
jgi:uncharacterized membrane protein